MTDRSEDWESDYWELLHRHAELWALVAEMVGVGDD